MKKKISILGSTGSIGLNSLKIIERKRKFFQIEFLSANRNFREISKQIKKFKPKFFVVTDRKIFLKAKKKFKKSNSKILNDYDNISSLRKKADITISAIPGIAGLNPTIKFTKISKKILLANKESIICGWEILKKVAAKHKTKIIPVDSEHYSIYKLIENCKNEDIESIYLTASGGPFLNLPKKNFNKIKPAQALKHPKWKMGKKISIDSATLMNKVFEIIEAQKIFDFDKHKFKMIIHPQSLVHAIVKFKSGLVKFLYHEPNMIIPIANAIFENKFEIKDYLKIDQQSGIRNLEFLKVDQEKFPVVKMIPKLNRYESAGIIINAANEILIDQFLKKRISFNSISRYLFKVLKDKNFKKYAIKNSKNLKNIYMIDQWSRTKILEIISKKVK